jgi:transposase
VASDVFGMSGRAMLRALIAGETDPAAIANLARGTLRRKLKELALALEGCVDDHHRFMLGLQLQRIEAAERDLADLDKQIQDKLVPYETLHRRLQTIPGVRAIG